MKFSITWDGILGRVSKDGVKGTLKVKPNIPNLQFDTLYFEPDDGNYFKTVGGFNTPLTEYEVVSIEQFMRHFNVPPQSFHMVDLNGLYLGYLPEGRGRIPVPVAPPNGDFWKWDFGSTQWQRPEGVNQDGEWVANHPSIFKETSPPPSHGIFVYDFLHNDWKETDESIRLRHIAEIQNELLIIDQAKVRAITEALLSGDNTRLQALEAEAAKHRAELKELINV